MKLLIITPTKSPTISGNAIDVERIVIGLKKYVDKIKIVTPDNIKINHKNNHKNHHKNNIKNNSGNNLNIEQIKKFNPDVIHAFHAYKSSIAVKLCNELDKPLVLTLTGTDYNHHIKNTQKKKVVMGSINKASAITVFSNKTKKLISTQVPKIKNKVYRVRRDKPILKSKKGIFKKQFKINKNDFVFTLIAGIRSVKNNLFPIKPLKKLHEKYPNIKFIMAGPILDNKYFLKMNKEIKHHEWIKYIGTVSRDKIKQVYESSNVIINCSHSEGLSNVVFEAMFLGKAILVSDIPGNKFLVNNNISCLSYKHDNQGEFYKNALKLYEDKVKLRKLGVNAKKKALKMINPKEAKEYYGIYRKVINS